MKQGPAHRPTVNGPAPVGEALRPRRPRLTAEPAGALSTLSKKRMDETRCDPLMVQRGVALVEANARAEGMQHARQRKMRIKTIPPPFAMAYVGGYFDEWDRMNREASDEPN